MYAIIETGGKQVRVEVGSKIYVEKLDAEVGSTITLDKVLLIGDKAVKVGTPYLDGAPPLTPHRPSLTPPVKGEE